jgi:predicted DNA-binding transcriptional regulator AlpA
MTQIYVRADKAHEILDVSKTTFWRMSKTEGFPNKRKIQGVSLYYIQEIIDWVESHSDSKAS